MLVLAGPSVSANAIAINKDVGVHTKMPLNVRTRVVSPTGIAERTASLEIRLKLQLASGLRGGLSIIIINPGLDSRARTALEHMLESVVRARGKVLRTNFSATSRVTRATKLTQAASRHSYRWCSPPTRGSATTFAVGDGRCVTALKLGVSLFSPKWQRSS